MQRFIALTIALAGSGCTLLIDGSQYVGTGSDGGTDAAADPNGPSAPTVEIAPSSATTTDDLVARITTESVDPLGGTVSYGIRWLRDGTAVAGATTLALPSTMTARGETWAVEVTPTAEPGGRVGSPGIAEITISNTPPTLATVGLDAYQPVVGETVRAQPGTTADADGDSVSIRYAWLRNGTAIEGAMTGAFTTATLAADDELVLRATPFDGTDEGPPVTVGPISLLANVTRWRVIHPSGIASAPPALAYDVDHERFVRFAEGHVFEYVSVAGRVAVRPLPASGGPPATGRVYAVHDGLNRRLLVVAEDDPVALYALSLEDRGAEQWTRVVPGGDVPPFRVQPSFASTGSRIWMFGGLNDGVPFFGDLHSLDISTPGAESWTRHTIAGSAPSPRLGAALGVDPTNSNRLVLVGGVSGRPPLATSDVTFLDVSAGTMVVATPSAAVAPTGSMGALAIPRDDSILFVGGLRTFEGSEPASSWELELAGETVTSVDLGANTGAFGVLSDQLADASWVLWPGLRTLAGRPQDDFEFASLSVEGPPSLTVTAASIFPGAARHAQVAPTGSGLRLHGGEADGVVSDSLLDFEFATASWSRPTIAPDPVVGAGPGPRSAVVTSSSSAEPVGVVLVGGFTASDTLADMGVWELPRVGAMWVQRSLAGGETAPPQRHGASVASGGCGGQVLHVFGGARADDTPIRDAQTLVCLVGDRLRDCHWEPLGAASVPAARSYATLAPGPGTSAWLFGGATSATSAVASVSTIDPCAGSPAWAAVVPTGTGPAARMGHSMSVARAAGLTSFFIHGGTTDLHDPGPSSFDDVFQLEVISATTARWVALAPEGPSPGRRSFHAAMWDDVRRRLMVFGGAVGSSARGDLWELLVP